MKGSVFAFQGNDFARNAAFALDLLIAERKWLWLRFRIWRALRR
jgi:hypothetical protein